MPAGCKLAVLVLGCAFLGAAAPASGAKRHSAPIVLQLDARDAPQNLLHAHLVLPAKPGALTLVYPRWVPGEHGPTGPLNGVVGLRMAAGGRPLEWRRDDVDMYAFHCTVPRGAAAIEVDLDFLATTTATRFTSGRSTTEALAILNWNQVVLYPQGSRVRELQVTPSLVLPAGWQFGTALEVADDSGETITFAPVTLETLVDSPVLAGKHFRTVPLTHGDPPDVQIDMACDSEAGLAMAPSLAVKYQRLVFEADALFGARHFRRYRFLLALSDHIAHFGIEHHESSDNRVPERALLEEGRTIKMATLLPHEYVHSWNGKYRRPVGLATPDYQQPMQGELLWVYEGLTQYLGFVLTARSGLRSPEIALEHLADVAAYLDQRPGRTWRPLRDTAVAAQLVFQAPEAGAEARRAADFYNEGLLLWLDADVAIREKSGGTRTLDDFVKRFHGGTSGPPRVVPFTLDDIVADLQAIVPHDWRRFLVERLDSTAPHAPLGGIVQGGWQLVWGDSLPRLGRHLERAGGDIDLRYSIGLRVEPSGRIADVVPGGSASRAGVAGGAQLVAVDGRKWTPEILREAIRATRTGSEPLDLLLEEGDFYVHRSLDWRGGERYPRLRRDTSRPDVLGAILTSQVRAVAARGD
jgi:predicted metalloprotease with PDZ domain